MPLGKFDIEKIEAYLSQKMAAQEKILFEQQMANDDELRQEVAVYEQIFVGFEGLQVEAFSGKMAHWENEWKEVTKDETDLIEWYINGELSEALQATLDNRVAQDATFAQKVEEYKSLLSGFKGIQTGKFSDTIKSWEENKSETPLRISSKPDAKVRSLRTVYIRLSIAASILLVIGFGINQYAQQKYSSTALVANYYQRPESDNRMGGNETGFVETTAERFQKAHEFFTQGQYEDAIDSFDQLLRTVPDTTLDELIKKYYLDNSSWNKTLAMLAAGKDKSEVNAALQSIMNDANHEYRNDAQTLYNRLNSLLGKLAG